MGDLTKSLSRYIAIAELVAPTIKRSELYQRKKAQVLRDARRAQLAIPLDVDDDDRASDRSLRHWRRDRWVDD